MTEKTVVTLLRYFFNDAPVAAIKKQCPVSMFLAFFTRSNTENISNIIM